MAASKKQKTVTLSPQALLIYSKVVLGQKLPGAKIKGKNVATIKTGYQSTDVISHLTKIKQAKDIKENFFNLETHKLSALVPEIRLYKVELRAGKPNYVPFYFPTSTDISAFENMGGPGNFTGRPFGTDAVGIQNFDVTFEGTDPYTAKRFLRCNLSIYTDSLENIFKDNPTGYAKLADLFTISRAAQSGRISQGGGRAAPRSSTFDASKFEIGAIIGYTGGNNLLTDRQRADIEESKLALRMTLINHTINVNQDGSATIQIEYTARIDTAMNSPLLSLSTVSSNDVCSLLAGIYEAEEQEASQLADAAKKSDLIKSIKRSKKMNLSAIIREEIFGQLESEGKIHDIEVTNLLTKYYADAGRTVSETAAEDAVGSAEARAAASKTRQPAPKRAPIKTGAEIPVVIPLPGDHIVTYVNFGDFIDMIYRFIRSRLKKVKKHIDGDKKISKEDGENRIKVIDQKIMDLDMTKVLLANLEIPTGVQNAESKEINLADIPISFSLLQEVFFKKVINLGKNDLTPSGILKLSIRNILPGALKQFSFGGAVFLKTGVSVVSTTYSGDKLPDGALDRYKNLPLSKAPAMLKRRDKKGQALTSLNDYFLIHQAPSKTVGRRGKGNQSADSESNIFHFRLGKDRGLIKTINFSRFDIPYKQESLMVESVAIYDELRMPYSAQITMFGNCLFHPGSQIYIDPYSIGFGDPRNKGSAAYRLGLGGYYTVLKVHHSISSGVFETRLECSFGAWANDPTNAPGSLESTVSQITGPGGIP